MPSGSARGQPSKQVLLRCVLANRTPLNRSCIARITLPARAADEVSSGQNHQGKASQQSYRQILVYCEQPFPRIVQEPGRQASASLDIIRGGVEVIDDLVAGIA